MKNKISIIASILLIVFLNGCGGGGSGSSSADTTTSTVTLETGYLIDSPVVGANYECGDRNETTQSGGKLECESGKNITFKIGNLTIGSINGFTDDKNIYLQDIANVSRDNFDDEYTAKLAVLLQSLDDDGNITDEITIDNAIFLESLNLKDISVTKLNEIIKASNKKTVFKYKAIEHLKKTFNKSSQKYITVSRGRELISTNGVDTTVVKKINTASDSSSPSNLLTIGSYTYFTAKENDDYGLWRTDGTTDGTILLLLGNNFRLTDVSGILYFTQNRYDVETSTSYGGLWKSDGSIEGTKLIKEFSRADGYSVSIEYLTALGEALYFTLHDSSNNYGLWKSDGSEAGTILVKKMDMNFANLTAIGNTLYCNYNTELWSSDGTDAGTVLVKDLGEYTQNINGTNNKIYVRTINALWISDGSDTNTSKIKAGLDSTYRYNSYLADDILYFNTDRALWKSDGTSDGTVQLNSSVNLSYGFRNIFNTENQTVYFLDTSSDRNLWKSDATEAGTQKVFSTNANWANIQLFDGNIYINLVGRAFEKSSLIKYDIATGNSSIIKENMASSIFHNPNLSMSVLNNKLILPFSEQNTGEELWSSDGTAQNTTIIKDIKVALANSAVSNLTYVDDIIYFTALDKTHGYELWKSDGMQEGTTIVKDIVEGTSGAKPKNLTNINGSIYFSVEDFNNVDSLWKSDGTEDGTVKIKDNFTYLYNFIYLNNYTYFIAKDSTSGTELWKSDGTQDGTSLVKDIYSGSTSSYPNTLMSMNNTLYFRANDGTNGYELWRSDGTEDGTSLVKDIRNGSDGSGPELLLTLGNKVFFTADDGIIGKELWKSNGTQEGTVLVKDITVGSNSSSFGWSQNNIQVATDGYMLINGALWKVNDVEAKQVKKIPTTNENDRVSINRLFKLNDKILLVVEYLESSSNNYQAYPQIWISDGTTDGTKLLKTFKDSSYEWDELYIQDTLLGNKILLDIEMGYGEDKIQILTDGTSFGTGIVE